MYHVQYSRIHSMINHCDRHFTVLSDTDISFALFNLITYFLYILCENNLHSIIYKRNFDDNIKQNERYIYITKSSET